MRTQKQGEQVSFSYSAGSIPTAATPLVLYDSNGNARPLQVWERLLLDMVSFDTEAADTTNLVYLIAGSTASVPTVPSSGSAPANTVPLIAGFTVAQGLPDQGTMFPAEGYSLPVGQVPYIVYSGSASGTVEFSGTGRVINGKTQGFKAGYKAVLTPGTSDINA